MDMTEQNHDEMQNTAQDENVVQDAEIENPTDNVADDADVCEAEVVSEEEADQATANEETPKAEETEDAPKAEETPKAEEAPKAKADQTDWKDSYIRLAADFDNYRKRTSKDLDDARKRAREGVINEWLEVYDNTERAIMALPEKEGVWFEGFQAILKQMDTCLAKFGIKCVDDTGAKFDPKRHEAVSVLPNPSLENGTIMYVERKGFVYENGDVMRTARVIVVRNPT